MTYPAADKAEEIITQAKHVVIIQADNPDADSLGSALALEELLGQMSKQVTLYCGVDIPTYLRYLTGWDRVSKDLPTQFDASIIVDASTYTLLEKLQEKQRIRWIATKPTIILDHHSKVENVLEFAAVNICDPKVSSTGELLFHLAKQVKWSLNNVSGTAIMAAILGDTQGLANDLTTAQTYRVMAELIDIGVDRVHLEELRREFGKMSLEVFKYKAQLIERTAFAANGRIAYVSVPQTEINAFSPLYNPAPLIQTDMLQTTNVALAIVFKHYEDGRLTAAIRANPGFAVANELAVQMGGGGHPNASGFKIVAHNNAQQIVAKCLELGRQLLDNLEQETDKHEALQHPNQTS